MMGYKQRKAISDLIFQKRYDRSLIGSAHIRTESCHRLLVQSALPCTDGTRSPNAGSLHMHSPCDHYHSQDGRKGRKKKKERRRGSPMDDICSLSLWIDFHLLAAWSVTPGSMNIKQAFFPPWGQIWEITSRLFSLEWKTVAPQVAITQSTLPGFMSLSIMSRSKSKRKRVHVESRTESIARTQTC